MPRNRSEKAPPEPTFPDDHRALVMMLRLDAEEAFRNRAHPVEYDNESYSDEATSLINSQQGMSEYQRAWATSTPPRRGLIFFQILEHLYATQSK